MYPGAIALTLTPRPAHSLASALVNCATRALRGSVGRHADAALKRQHRRDVDDLTAAAIEHVPAGVAAQAKDAGEIDLEHRCPSRRR